MRLLLDTHALLWWLFNDPKLSGSAREVIRNPDNDILVSSASAWEIATKHRLGKLPDADDVVAHLPLYLRKARFTELMVSIEHALAAGSLPRPHKDPFDRMLIAQARFEGVSVITIDTVFKDYGVQVLW